MQTMETWVAPLLALLALPQYGLSAVFVIAFISATLLPLGSEPAVWGLVKLNPDCSGRRCSWPPPATRWRRAHLVDGLRRRARLRARDAPSRRHRALRWLERFGAKACLLSWLPLVGDPLCAVAGWLQAAVLALRALHGDRQVRALPDDDRRVCCGCRGSSTPEISERFRRGSGQAARKKSQCGH
jgi:membrane protein YqaA with SNARE-associated domain